MKLARFPLAAIIIICCSMPVSAAELELPRPKGAPTSNASKPANPTASVHNFGNSDKACMAWTDGCVNCTRGENDQPQCSNIGPACQPKAVRCTSSK